ncbi:hypothetical protein D3C72_1203610 [compost metagenome]
MFIAVGFLGRALQYADALTFQGLQGWLNVRRLCDHQTRIRCIEFVGEGNLLLAFFGDREGGHNHVDFLRFQRGDQRVQRVLNVGTLRFDALAQFIGDIDVKTNQFTFRIL